MPRKRSISIQEAMAHPIVLQSRALMIRRYLETRHGWLFSGGQKVVEANSLQLVKMLARGGDYIAFTSELDAAPELIEGVLVFVPVRDKGAEPQSVSIAIDSRKPIDRIGRIVAQTLMDNIEQTLARVQSGRGP